MLKQNVLLINNGLKVQIESPVNVGNPLFLKDYK
jgi:hypothetical protein